jgi:hypothetical protein
MNIWCRESPDSDARQVAEADVSHVLERVALGSIAHLVAERDSHECLQIAAARGRPVLEHMHARGLDRVAGWTAMSWNAAQEVFLKFISGDTDWKRAARWCDTRDWWAVVRERAWPPWLVGLTLRSYILVLGPLILVLLWALQSCS